MILRFNKERKLLSAENRLIPVSEDIKPDSAIADAVSALTAKVSIVDTGDNKGSPVLSIGDPNGVFPFISDRNDREQVFLKVPEQMAEFPISGKLTNATNPVVSFSASKMACIIKTDTCQKLEVISFNRSGKRSGLDSFDIRKIFITPDGKWLYISAKHYGKKSTDIFKQRIEGGPYFPVFESDSSNATDVAFSSTENMMAFCTDKDGTYQIFLSDQSGLKPVAITSGKADHFSPQFSADGERIAYLSDRSNFGGKLDIWMYDCKLKEHKQITSHSNVKEFCWLPDSRTIVFSSGVNIYDLYKVETSNFRFSRLFPRDSTKTFDERSPALIKYKNEFRIAYTREYISGMKKIYWANIDGTNEQCIVNSKSNDWMPEYRR
jgi:tricorn protease-like protein